MTDWRELWWVLVVVREVTNRMEEVLGLACHSEP